MKAQFPKLGLSVVLAAAIPLIVAIIGLEHFFVYQGYQWAKEQQVTNNEECQNLVRKPSSVKGSSGDYADRRRVKGCEEYVTELTPNFMSP
jgi:hypothetical protein